MKSACLTEDEVLALAAGDLAVDARLRLVEHLDECGDCRELFAALARDDGPAPIPAGAAVGRYVVRGVLGAGAMGIVYEAEDLALDRGVALKLVRPEGDDERRGKLRERLLREARALASIAHPNIIVVYETGTHGEDVFIAMELVRGDTLATWLQRAPRTWSEIVEVFQQAGAGLAAAHRAGLVHRDVKPENIMVGEDGRVRVTDFGLARGWLEPLEGERASVPASAIVTQGLLGTPRYMAPEQRAGRAATPAADQFAFAVALAEALDGADDRARVPARVQAAVARARAIEPEARWPSMDALQAALAAATRPRRWLEGAALALVLGALAVLAWPREDPVAMCMTTSDAVAAVWSPSVAAALPERFRAQLGARGDVLAARTAEALDRYAASYRAMVASACQATHAQGTQSSALLDLRLRCLDHRREALRALVGALEAPPVDVLEHLLSSALELPPIEDCARRDSLLAREPLPVDPASRAEHEAIDRALVEVETLHRLHRVDEAIAASTALVERAERAGARAALARALLVSGSWAGDAKQRRRSLHRAAAVALEIRDDEALADAWITLVEHTGRIVADLEATEALALEARGVLRRLGGDARREGRLEIALCAAYERVTDLDRAELACRRGAALVREARGDDDSLLVITNDELGNLAFWRGDYAGALAAWDRSVALGRRLFGEASVAVDNTMANRAEALTALGRPAEAIATLEPIIPRRPEWEPICDVMANALRRQGKLEAALVWERRALERCIANANQACRKWALVGTGELLVELGRAREALIMLEEASALGTDSPAIDRARLAFALARALDGARRTPERAARLLVEGRASLVGWADKYGGTYAELDARIASYTLQRAR